MPAIYEEKIRKQGIKSLLRARSFLYVLESLPISKTQKYLAKGYTSYKPSFKEIDLLKQEVEALIDKDAEGFMQKHFPPKSLRPSSAFRHYRRYINILVDNVAVSLRKRKRDAKNFSKDQEQRLEKYPDYYRRNFHYQTDGYLSDASAEKYEHQVEILFKGTADPMRRRMVSLFKENNLSLGKKALELGAGVGSNTLFMAYAFGETEITCLDLSESYLQKAKSNLRDFSNINFYRGEAENLGFKDASYDSVFSTFLFHELPLEVRVAVLDEAHRVLKPGGLIAIADSIQLGDIESLDWAIKDFPKNFHEPFYTNYIKTAMEGLLESAGFEILYVDKTFLTKTILAKKI